MTVLRRFSRVVPSRRANQGRSWYDRYWTMAQ
jgi:hypothetical protein